MAFSTTRSARSGASSHARPSHEGFRPGPSATGRRQQVRAEGGHDHSETEEDDVFAAQHHRGARSGTPSSHARRHAPLQEESEDDDVDLATARAYRIDETATERARRCETSAPQITPEEQEYLRGAFSRGLNTRIAHPGTRSSSSSSSSSSSFRSPRITTDDPRNPSVEDTRTNPDVRGSTAPPRSREVVRTASGMPCTWFTNNIPRNPADWPRVHPIARDVRVYVEANQCARTCLPFCDACTELQKRGASLIRVRIEENPAHNIHAANLPPNTISWTAVFYLDTFFYADVTVLSDAAIEPLLRETVDRTRQEIEQKRANGELTSIHTTAPPTAREALRAVSDPLFVAPTTRGPRTIPTSIDLAQIITMAPPAGSAGRTQSIPPDARPYGRDPSSNPTRRSSHDARFSNDQAHQDDFRDDDDHDYSNSRLDEEAYGGTYFVLESQYAREESLPIRRNPTIVQLDAVVTYYMERTGLSGQVTRIT